MGNDTSFGEIFVIPLSLMLIKINRLVFKLFTLFDEICIESN